MLGVFVHQGAHYTGIIRRAGRVYHLDSRPLESGEGRFVFEMTPALFAEYAAHFSSGRLAPAGRRVGGLFSVYYVGLEVLAVVEP